MHVDLLRSWNRWGSHMRDSGCLRDVVGRIEPWLGCEEVLILQGLRHSGKTTVLYQLMDALERQGVEEKAMLHLNFEDPRLVPWLTTQGLEQGYQCYRREVCPSGKVYLFLMKYSLFKVGSVGFEAYAIEKMFR